jgi:dephospho-CoA kinase
VQTIGITGGIGSGKSTVCRIFHAMGIPVYTADDRAKYLTNTLPVIREEITELLGNKAYTTEGYDRKYVASIVFDDPSLLAAINKIIHPRVAEDFKIWKLHQHAVPYYSKVTQVEIHLPILLLMPH